VTIPANATPIDLATYNAAVSLADARTDEFRGGPALDGKWQSVGAAFAYIDANNAALDGLYMQHSAGAQLGIRYQAFTPPCTIVAKLVTGTPGAAAGRQGGLCLLPASPTASSPCTYCGAQSATPNYAVIAYTNLTTFGSNVLGQSAAPFTQAFPMWLRLILSSATNLTMDFASDGMRWLRLLTNYTVPFSVANIGLGMSSEGGGTSAGIFDYFRVVP